jgi:hypothetical protein
MLLSRAGLSPLVPYFSVTSELEHVPEAVGPFLLACSPSVQVSYTAV